MTPCQQQPDNSYSWVPEELEWSPIRDGFALGSLWRFYLNIEDPQEEVRVQGPLAPLATLKSFLWVAGPKVMAGALQLLGNLVLLRSLGPAASGIVFVLMTVIVLCDGVFGVAFDLTVIRLVTAGGGSENEHYQAVQKTALVSKWLMCGLVALPVVVWSGRISELLFSSRQGERLLPLAMIAVGAILTLRSVQTYLQIKGSFVVYGLAEAVHAVARFLAIAGLASTGTATPARILWVLVLAPSIVAIGMALISARPLLMASVTWPAARDLLRVGPWYLAGAAAGSVTSRMDLLILSSVAGSVQAGIFSSAQNLTVPFQLVGQYLGVVLAPRIMPLWRSGRLPALYWQLQMAALTVCIFSFIAFWWAVEWMVPALLPASYQPGIEVARWLAPAALTALLTFPLTVPLLLFAYPRFLLVLDAIAIPILLITYDVVIRSHGALGAAMVSSAYALFKVGAFQMAAVRALRGPRPTA